MHSGSVQLELQMVLRGHKYGVSQISLVASDVLVTVGDSNDRGMLVWEVVSPRLVSANMKKAGMILGVCKVRGGENELRFLSYGTYGHLKTWVVKVERDKQFIAYNVE